MNFDAPPRRRWVRVVAWLAVGAAVLLLLLVFGGYYALMHTSLPFKAVEAMLSSGGPNDPFHVEGISGSLSKGFRIKRIRWGIEGTDASVIEDVRVTYQGFGDLMGGRRVVFREIHIGKAHLDVTGLEQLTAPQDDSSSEDEEPATNAPAPPTPATWPPRRGARNRPIQPASGRGLELFQIDSLTVEDVFLTNRVTGFALTIPAIEWKGFKSARGKVELGSLTVKSDRLTMETKAGETVQIDGAPVAFKKRLEGTILPRLHQSVRRPIAFTIDADYVTNLTWRLSAFEGRLEAYRAPDRGGFLRCKDIDLASYFEAPLPTALTMEMTHARKGKSELTRLGPGRFKLGVSTFAIQPSELERTPGAQSTNCLTALSVAGGANFKYQLFIPEEPWNIEQRLAADPAMAPEETLARVLLGKSFAELPEVEQSAIKVQESWFGRRPAHSKTNQTDVKLESEQ